MSDVCIKHLCYTNCYVYIFRLSGLYPNTMYFMWLAAKSIKGEGATTPPIPVRTEQYSKYRTCIIYLVW